jgi:hypothetical protein
MKGVMAFITCNHVRHEHSFIAWEDVAAELELDNPELSEWAVARTRHDRGAGSR